MTIETITPGQPITLPGFEVVTAAVPHGSMWTTAYRITADGKTVTFLSDVEYPSIDDPLPQALALAHEADLLIHDAMHADHDYDLRRAGGTRPPAREWWSPSAPARRSLRCFITVPTRPTI